MKRNNNLNKSEFSIISNRDIIETKSHSTPSTISSSTQKDNLDETNIDSILDDDGDSDLSWLSELDNLDFLSIRDSGFNSSSSFTSASFQLDFDPSHAQIENGLDSNHLVGNNLVFDADLVRLATLGWRRGFNLDLDDIVSSPTIVLSNAFSSWSKSSLLRLSHSVMTRFITRPMIENRPCLEERAASVEEPIEQLTWLTLGEHLKTMTTNRLYEYKANLIYKFYSHYSFNFC